MPKCSICGAKIERLPDWLDVVQVTFRCGNCPDPSAGLIVPAEDDDEETAAAPDAVEEETEEEDEDEEEDTDE